MQHPGRIVIGGSPGAQHYQSVSMLCIQPWQGSHMKSPYKLTYLLIGLAILHLYSFGHLVSSMAS